ncbi:hypothetical protein [Bradyrhizobium cenepequi]
MHAVVFEEMRIGCDGAKVIDRDDVNIVAPGLMRRAQDLRPMRPKPSMAIRTDMDRPFHSR